MTNTIAVFTIPEKITTELELKESVNYLFGKYIKTQNKYIKDHVEHSYQGNMYEALHDLKTYFCNKPMIGDKLGSRLLTEIIEQHEIFSRQTITRIMNGEA